MLCNVVSEETGYAGVKRTLTIGRRAHLDTESIMNIIVIEAEAIVTF